jgi:hypothetical protein
VRGGIVLAVPGQRRGARAQPRLPLGEAYQALQRREWGQPCRWGRVCWLRFQASAAGVVVHEGQQQTPVPPGPKDIELAQSHPDVAEVLSVLGKDSPSLDWFDLYKVYEIVRDNVGGEAALSGKDWLPKRDIKAFTVSANRPDISGDQARHARSSGPPPKRTRPMTLSEAQQMIPSSSGAGWIRCSCPSSGGLPGRVGMPHPISSRIARSFPLSHHNGSSEVLCSPPGGRWRGRLRPAGRTMIPAGRRRRVT